MCLADNRHDILIQLAAVLAAGCQSLWPSSDIHQQIARELPEQVRQTIQFTKQWQDDPLAIEAVIHHGDSDQLRTVCQTIAQRKGRLFRCKGLNVGKLTYY